MRWSKEVGVIKDDKDYHGRYPQNRNKYKRVMGRKIAKHGNQYQVKQNIASEG